MIGEEYNEKTQKLKVRIQELILAEYKLIDSRTNYINSLLESMGNSRDLKVELLNLKKDNEDSRALLFSYESMLKNRLTADGISRFTELFQGYVKFSDAITIDLKKFAGPPGQSMTEDWRS